VPLRNFIAGIDTRRRGRRAFAAACLAALAGLALVAPGRADAAADCSVTTGGMAFGVYDPTLSTPNDSTGSITVTCVYTGGSASGVSYTIAFPPGASGSYAQRRMVAGTQRLNYNLYRDANRTVVLGNGTGGTSMFTGSFTVGPGVGNGTRTATHTVYGRVPALQAVNPGNFSDPLVVTLTF
jgi:spore coat protein U-like protein